MTAEEVRSWRKRLGLSQVAAAELLGVAERTIRSWEHGEYKPSATAQRLMDTIERFEKGE